MKSLLAAVALAAAAAAPQARPLKLHVPSPDWRDQVIYFVMTDRFDDGDPRNNDQGQGEYRPGERGFWQGGDFAGLRRRLDYIRGLGATGVWVTPPVANRAFAPALGYAGYHGYWAEHFRQVDPHLGSLADYRLLSDALHRRGMVLVQDIVVNHVADYFHYAGGWDAADPARFYTANPDARGVTAPRQWPFSRNDPRRAEDRRLGIYHWTPDVRDYTDPAQEQGWQMSGLDDLNTENPRVRRALRASHGWWIREAGVDAFRVDTAFYVPPDYYADFLDSRDRTAPGMRAVARATGRHDFHVFGEGFGIDKPGETTQARKIEGYMRTPDGKPLLPGMLNFPLYGSLNQVFARGAPTAELAARIGATLAVHRDPHRMPTFLDNHDVNRFLATGTPAGLQQALLALMTLPGIPVIYYGTEQGFTQQRASMFARGWGSGGRDHFDPQHALYRFIARTTALRREHRVLSRGTPRLVASDAAGPGALAWVMEGGGQPERLLVAMNTADEPRLLDHAALGWPAGTPLQPLLALGGTAPALQADREGRVSVVLPPRAGFVWRAGAATQASAPAALAVQFDPLPAPRVGGDFELSGRAEPSSRFALVVDGRVDAARPVQVMADGQFRVRIDTAEMIDPAITHRAVAWADGRASAALEFQVDRPWTLAAERDDPEGDDHGVGAAKGRLRYPTDPGWGSQRQLDLRRVRVYTSGGAMRIELGMHRVTQGWNPANGFDRVAFSVFIGLPGQPEGNGARVLPLQRAELPEGMRWHRRLRAHGWSNALFAWPGASASADGTPAAPAARIEVDRERHMVRFTLPAAALGRLDKLSGAQVYVTTWDYDAGWRALLREAGPFHFGGATGDDDALVMDDSGVMTLR